VRKPTAPPTKIMRDRRERREKKKELRQVAEGIIEWEEEKDETDSHEGVGI